MKPNPAKTPLRSPNLQARKAKDKDWLWKPSAWELNEGVEVTEVLGTMPAELRELFATKDGKDEKDAAP